MEHFNSPRAWAFTLLGLTRTAQWWRRIRAPHDAAASTGRQVDVAAVVGRDDDWVWFEEGLAYDNARLPQALIATGWPTERARLRRGRPAILALAHVAADLGSRRLPARGLRELRRQAAAPARVRPAAPRSGGDDLGLSCRLARRRRRQMEGGRRARVRLVSRQQRSVGAAHRSRNGQLSRRLASRIARTKTGAANPSCPTCSRLAEIRQLARADGDSTEPAQLRALRA